MRRWIGVVAVGIAFVMSATPATAQTDAGSTKTARVKAAGITFEYPSEWTAYAVTKKDAERQRVLLEKQNPKLAEAFDANAFAGQSKFYASDLGATFRGEPSSNVSVLAFASGGFPSDLGDFEDGMRSEYRDLGATVLGFSETTVGKKKAYRADVTLPIKVPGGETIVARLGQLYAPYRGGGSVTTVTSTQDDRGIAVIDDVLASVRTL